MKSERWPPFLQKFTNLLLANIGTIIFIVVLALVRGVMLSITWPSTSYLVGVAASLATAWVVIALVAGLIRNQFVYRLVAVSAWTIAALSILDLLDPTVNALGSRRSTHALKVLCSRSRTRNALSSGSENCLKQATSLVRRSRMPRCASMSSARQSQRCVRQLVRSRVHSLRGKQRSNAFAKSCRTPRCVLPSTGPLRVSTPRLASWLSLAR